VLPRQEHVGEFANLIVQPRKHTNVQGTRWFDTRILPSVIRSNQWFSDG